MENSDYKSKEIIENEELILFILLYSKKYYTLKTRLIKLLFIFKEVFPINEESGLDLDFFPYNYGPTIDYDEYELLISTLKNYEFIQVEEKTTQKYDNPIIIIKIQEEKEEEIICMIKEKLIPEKPEYKIELIEKICNFFPNIDNKVLLQFVYYIREDFTEKSKIKGEIFNLSKKQLQDKIINIFKELRIRYLDIFLEYTEAILNIFDISKTTADYSIFNELFLNFHKGIKKNTLKISKNIIQNVDQMSLKDKKYHKLKLSLLDLFLKNLRKEWDNENIISILIFILKSLKLSWPLENPLERKSFVSLTSNLFRDYKFFYKPEEIFSVLEKSSATEEEIQKFILEFEEDLTHKEEKEEDKIQDEFDRDFTEDDELENEIIKKVNL